MSGSSWEGLRDARTGKSHSPTGDEYSGTHCDWQALGGEDTHVQGMKVSDGRHIHVHVHVIVCVSVHPTNKITINFVTWKFSRFIFTSHA